MPRTKSKKKQPTMVQRAARFPLTDEEVITEACRLLAVDRSDFMRSATILAARRVVDEHLAKTAKTSKTKTPATS